MTRRPDPEPIDIPITPEQYDAMCDELDEQWAAFKASSFGKALLDFGIPEIEDDTSA